MKTSIEKRVIKGMKKAGEVLMASVQFRCYLCKRCRKVNICIEKKSIPIHTYYYCKKRGIDIYNPFLEWCSEFKVKR
jgi:hypothetical protein